MKQSLNIGKEPNLQKIIIASIILHLLFITLVVIPIKTKEREYKSYFVPREFRRAVKAPAIKKSKTGKSEKGAIKVKSPLRRRVKPESKADMSLEPAERVTKEIERLRAISSLSKKKKQKEERIAKDREADEKIAHAIEVIRKEMQGSAAEDRGIPGTRTSVDSESYYALITQKIWSEWIYPDFDSAGLEVIINIKIDKSGKVISQKIEKSSGNTLFDHSATKAISKASPLLPPPVEMEIGVRFYL
jgi:colicin import membrane protein